MHYLFDIHYFVSIVTLPDTENMQENNSNVEMMWDSKILTFSMRKIPQISSVVDFLCPECYFGGTGKLWYKKQRYIGIKCTPTAERKETLHYMKRGRTEQAAMLSAFVFRQESTRVGTESAGAGRYVGRRRGFVCVCLCMYGSPCPFFPL